MGFSILRYRAGKPCARTPQGFPFPPFFTRSCPEQSEDWFESGAAKASRTLFGKGFASSLFTYLPTLVCHRTPCEEIGTVVPERFLFRSEQCESIYFLENRKDDKTEYADSELFETLSRF